MQLIHSWLLTTCFAAVVLLGDFTEARRIRVRPRPAQTEEEEDDPRQQQQQQVQVQPQYQYYAAEPQDDGGVVLVSSLDEYNGLFGQPRAVVAPQDNYIASSRTSSVGRENYINAARAQSQTKAASTLRTKETPKAPPVQTLRNYNKVNDDGSFTFGYEAADGSFKEETRGTDCVVRGKYGYVDPDGNKREFTYVSGNPCDPNAPKDSDEQQGNSNEEEEEADVSGPANYPKQFPLRPSARPTLTAAPKRRPTVTVFQNTYDQGGALEDTESDEDDEPALQVLRPTPRPRIIQQPTRQSPTPVTYIQPVHQQPQRFLPRAQPTAATTPTSSYLYRDEPVSITPKPTQPPATTYRPQLVQVAVTPRPSLYAKEFEPSRPIQPVATPPAPGRFDFNAEFRKFQSQQNVIAPTPKTIVKTTERTKTAPAQHSSGQIYSSELVYDPASGQYNTQLYQTLPQTTGDFTLSHRIQPFVHQQQQTRLLSLPQLQQQSPLYNRPTIHRPPITPSATQQLYQQNQAELQFQNSAQLFAQQQRARQQSAPQQQHRAAAPQQFFYIQPSLATAQQQNIAGGQIDAFLRGHNLQF